MGQKWPYRMEWVNHHTVSSKLLIIYFRTFKTYMAFPRQMYHPAERNFNTPRTITAWPSLFPQPADCIQLFACARKKSAKDNWQGEGGGGGGDSWRCRRGWKRQIADLSVADLSVGRTNCKFATCRLLFWSLYTHTNEQSSRPICTACRAGHLSYFWICSILKNDFFAFFYQVNNIFLHQSYLKSPLPVNLTW